MSRCKGFTLLELLVAVGIIAILFATAIPLFKNIIAKNRATTAINRLVGAINLARHEAIKYHAITTLCPSQNGHNCSDNWHDGMMLFVDKKGSGSFDTEDILLRVYGALTTQDKLTWAHRRKNYLQILPSGYLKGQNGTFLYCPADKDTRYARAIIISQTGRIRLSSDQDADGKPLQCL